MTKDTAACCRETPGNCLITPLCSRWIGQQLTNHFRMVALPVTPTTWDLVWIGAISLDGCGILVFLHPRFHVRGSQNSPVASSRLYFSWKAKVVNLESFVGVQVNVVNNCIALLLRCSSDKTVWKSDTLWLCFKVNEMSDTGTGTEDRSRKDRLV